MKAENSEWESRIITASEQNLSVPSADSVGLFHSLDNDRNIVTPFDLEFGWMHYVIGLSSFHLKPEEVDLPSWDARQLSC